MTPICEMSYFISHFQWPNMYSLSHVLKDPKHNIGCKIHYRCEVIHKAIYQSRYWLYAKEISQTLRKIMFFIPKVLLQSAISIMPFTSKTSGIFILDLWQYWTRGWGLLKAWWKNNSGLKCKLTKHPRIFLLCLDVLRGFCRCNNYW